MESGDDNRERWRQEIAGRRDRRREEERRRQRTFARRRLVAVAALVAAVALVLLLVGGSGGEEKPDAPVADRDVKQKEPKTTQEAEDAPPVDKPPVKLVRGFKKPVPILMYHVIAEAPPDAANPGLWVPPKELKQQVKWLAKEGFTAVTMGELFDAWENGAEIPSKPIVLSFDDGTWDQHENAAPILAAYGFPGVLNLKVASIDQKELAPKQVKEMIADGWEIGSHTISHPDLTTLAPDALADELAGSKKQLERRLGVPVDFFCYPAGAYNETVIEAVKEAGYRGATTTVPGLAERGAPYELSRVRVEPGDGAPGLRMKLESAGARI